MPHPRRLLALLLAAPSFLLSTSCAPTTYDVPASLHGHDPSLISNNSGSLISNNSGALCGVFRAPSSLVSNNTGAYRLAAVSETPVAGAVVEACTAEGTPIASASTLTDAAGRYTLRVPGNAPILVKASLEAAGKTYSFQTLGACVARGTGSADISAGTSLAAEQILQVAKRKEIDDPIPLIAARLASLGDLFAAALDSNALSRFTEGQAALLAFTNSLLSSNRTLADQAVTLNGYTGLWAVGSDLYFADNTRGVLASMAAGGFAVGAGGMDGTFADGPVASARFHSIYGQVRAADGTIYVADAGNHRVRRLTPAGSFETLAGLEAGFADGPGATARFDRPISIALVGRSLFVADMGNDRIRCLDLDLGTVSTIAGNPAGSFGDGPALQARLATPRGLVADPDGALYFADSSNSEIRRLVRDPAGTWQIETIAGNALGVGYGAIVNGTGRNALFMLPMAMSYHQGALFVADSLNNAIRRLDLATREVTTLAGAGPYAPGDVDGVGSAARFRGPDSIAVADDGTIYVGDGGNLSLRRLQGQTVTTVRVELP